VIIVCFEKEIISIWHKELKVEENIMVKSKILPFIT